MRKIAPFTVLDRYNMQFELNALISQLHGVASELVNGEFKDKIKICQEIDALLVSCQEKIKKYTNSNNAF